MTRPPLPAGPNVIAVVGAAILLEEKCFVARRDPGGSSGGLWEFPGGKIELGETPEEALRREIDEELAVRIQVLDWIGRGEFSPLPERRIILDVYQAVLTDGALESAGPAHTEIKWAHAEELSVLDWAHADLPVVDLVAKRLQKIPEGSQS